VSLAAEVENLPDRCIGDSDIIRPDQPPKENPVLSKPSNGWLLAAVLAVLFVSYLAFPRVVHSRLRYFLQYGRRVGWIYERVTTDKTPDDCDWFKEPLGGKKCHYQAKVKFTVTGKDAVTGESVQYSGDQDGPLPANFNKAHAHIYTPVVLVRWEKVTN
jgi:hypothetical protein